MLGKTDFFSFYEQLGLHPDCSPDELRNAYRRRVAELHPDRLAGRADPANAGRLQELTAAYNAASSFQRRYGRLPGAQHVSARGAALPSGSPRQARAASPQGSGLRLGALVVFALAIVAWLLWSIIATDDLGQLPDTRAEPTLGATIPDAAAEPSRVIEQRLQLGMDTDTVRAIEGSPVMTSSERWDYGPSWIQFDHDRVSDWYSSRLHPLKVLSARPPATVAP